VSTAIRWYRTPIDREVLRHLCMRSDWLGGLYTAGYLAIYLATASLAVLASVHSRWPLTLVAVFAHGMVVAFAENAMHELSHGTVFRSRSLNELFVRVTSFLGWLNFVTFNASHTRHHAYTLHPPHDMEVVLPMRLTVKDFLKEGFVNVGRFRTLLKETVRIARGRFQGDWELISLPESDRARRHAATRWARALLFGHAAVVVICTGFGWWMIPIVVTFGPFYGGWLFFLCNNTQHIGTQDNVADFRLCCRSFTLNPVVRFVYWQMNYHIEHHMYPAVPCYRLAQLHRVVAHEMPTSPRGIAATWREIAAIQRRQRIDPSYRHVPAYPPGRRD